MKALIIGPSSEDRDVLELLLRGRGRGVSCASERAAGLEQHAQTPFELVFVEGGMAEALLLDTARHLKRPPGEALIVAVYGGAAGPERVEQLLTNGCDDWLPIPFSDGSLRTRLLVTEKLVGNAQRRRAAEEALQQSEARIALADRLASVGTLAAGVAHELNNPLAYVLSNLRLMGEELELRREVIPEATLIALAELVEESAEGAARMGNIVRDLKTFARADDEARGPVDLGPIIQSSINMVSNEVRHRAKLITELAATPKVEANESRIGQVVVNLILNATQALDDADGPNEIRVGTRTDDRGWALITVEDTGAGIAAEDLERIFDPFFTTKAAGEGTGLGLSICHNIVTNAGGRIDIESTVGRGTAVRVSLPPARRLTRRASSMRLHAVGTSRRAKVLVVDDEPMVARSLSRALRGHDVTVAEDGAEAIRLLTDADRSFDIVLCDLMMPGVTGMDVYEHVRAASQAVADRIVFMTGGAFTTRGRDFLDRVANEQIEKPFDLALVREIVAQAAADP